MYIEFYVIFVVCIIVLTLCSSWNNRSESIDVEFIDSESANDTILVLLSGGTYAEKLNCINLILKKAMFPGRVTISVFDEEDKLQKKISKHIQTSVRVLKNGKSENKRSTALRSLARKYHYSEKFVFAIPAQITYLIDDWDAYLISHIANQEQRVITTIPSASLNSTFTKILDAENGFVLIGGAPLLNEPSKCVGNLLFTNVFFFCDAQFLKRVTSAFKTSFSSMTLGAALFNNGAEFLATPLPIVKLAENLQDKNRFNFQSQSSYLKHVGIYRGKILERALKGLTGKSTVYDSISKVGSAEAAKKILMNDLRD